MSVSYLVEEYLKLGMQRRGDVKNKTVYRKEEGKYQESIRSSTTPDPGHHMVEVTRIQENLIYKRQDVSPFKAGDHKAAMNRPDIMADQKHNKQ